MNIYTSTILLVTALSIPALAADLPPPPEPIQAPARAVKPKPAKVEKHVAKPPPVKVVKVKQTTARGYEARLTKGDTEIAISCTETACKATRVDNGKMLDLGKGGIDNFNKNVENARSNGWQ